MKRNQEVIAIYIHPDSGPILPMELDIDAVRLAMYSAPDSQADEVGLREIVRQIRLQKAFQNVEPESNRPQLAAILNRLPHAHIFNGVVLRLKGQTAATSSTASDHTVIEQQLKKMTQSIVQLQADLSKAREEKDALNLRFYTAEREKQRYKVRYDQLQPKLTHYEITLQQKETELLQERSARKRSEQEAASALQATSALQTRLELLEKERRERPAGNEYVEEIARLRPRIKQLEAEIEDWKATVAQLEQERDALKAPFQQFETGSNELKYNPYEL